MVAATVGSGGVVESGGRGGEVERAAAVASVIGVVHVVVVVVVATARTAPAAAAAAAALVVPAPQCASIPVTFWQNIYWRPFVRLDQIDGRLPSLVLINYTATTEPSVALGQCVD